MAVTQPFKVKCESCELIFVINDPSFVGKQISCRRCKFQFRIPQPAESRVIDSPVARVDPALRSGNGRPHGTDFVPFKVKCALCELIFVVTDPGFIGKKIRCRQCQYHIRIEQPLEQQSASESAKNPASPVPVTPAVEIKTPPPQDVPVTTGPVENTGVPPAIAPPVEVEVPASEEATIVDSVPKLGKKKRKKKLKKGGSKVTRLGVGIGGVALGLIIGGYFAFFGGGSNSTAPKNAPEIAKQTGPSESTQPKKESPVDPKGPKPADEPAKEILPVDGRLISNLLPEDSQWVLSLSKEIQKTPVFRVLLDKDGPGKSFKKWMGFEAEKLEEFLISGGLDRGWVFVVIKLTDNIAIADLQNVMQLEPKETILKRDYYRIKSNDLLTIMGEYISSEMEAQGVQIPLVDPSETMSLHLLDSRTLVIAHTAAMQKFLTSDTKRVYQTRYKLAVPAGNQPDSKNPKAGPPKAKTGPQPPPRNSGQREIKLDDFLLRAPKQPGASAKEPEPGKDDAERGLSNDPTYLTIDPALKIMMNQIELDKKPMVSFAVKFDDLKNTLPGLFWIASQQVAKLPANMIPNAPVIGLRVQAFDDRKLSLSLGLQLDSLEQKKFWLEPLNRLLPGLAKELTEVIGVKITPTRPNAVALGAKVKDDYMNSNVELGSFLWTTTHDRLIATSFHVDWRIVYSSLINHNLRFQIDLLRGKALMSTGRAHWAGLAPAIKTMEKNDRSIPQGAYPRKVNESRFNVPYPPQERVGWMVDMLPFLGYEEVFRRIDKELPWNDDKNYRSATAWIPEFLNPSFPQSSRMAIVPSMRRIGYGATHFTGLSGIGWDAGEYPDTPEYATKLGIFGYERRTSFQDIVAGDGTSNTIFMIQAPPHPSRPWIRGGGATVQGVPLKNSVGSFVSEMPSGRKGTIALMADGSIRYIGADISDEVFQALVTYKGGEQAGEIEKLAPQLNPSETELKANPTLLVNVPKGIEWKEVEIREIAGVIRMPSDPEKTVTPELVAYTWPPKQGEELPILTLGVFIPPTRINSPNGTEGELDDILAEMAKKGYNPEKKVRVTIGGRPGRQYEISTSLGVRHQQLFISGSKAVIMEVPKNGRATPAEVKKFFESVKVGGGGVSVVGPIESKAETPKSEPKATESLPAPRVKEKSPMPKFVEP